MSIALSILNAFSGGLFTTISDLGKKLIDKQVSQADFDAQIKKHLLDSQTQIEQAWATASSAQFESFQATVRSSPIIQRGYIACLISQLFVLVWYQWGSPAFLLITGKPWPNPGATVEWAYLLLGVMLGAGPLVFNRGASALGDIASRMVPKK